MNRQRARELLPIIEAYANGDEIEVRSNVSDLSVWISLSEMDEEPTWQEDCEYRIKPKAREWWLCINDSDVVMCVTDSESTAKSHCDSGETIIKVREVL